MKTKHSAFLAGSALSVLAAAQTTPFDADLRADAAWRTSSLAEGGAGWEKGNFYISDGGANTLKIYGFAQFRYLMNFRDEDSAGSQNDFTHGFQMRRARINARGTIWDKKLSYEVVGEFSRSSGTFGLLDAYGQYAFDNGISIRWGQFKPMFLRETNVSDTKQLTVERSVMEHAFTLNRAQGVQGAWEGESARAFVGFYDGGNSLNTDFNSSSEADFLIVGRADFRWGEGDFKRFEDNTSWRGDPYAGMAGAGLYYQDGGETGFTADRAVFGATADISIEGDGWNAFAAGVWQHTEPGAGSDTDDFGLVVQGGIFVTDQVEPFLRYDAVFADDANGDDFHTITGGVNYYVSPRSHVFKITGDVVYYIDNEGASGVVSPSTSPNLLADTSDGQVAVRLQAQVLW
jgi:hypothetical protein